ncbi:carbohydrate-binding domain-containing protein [Corynebacterium neomassiliense]|uniref:carbohydrate-binding domain-containing protein n=1 Tax=Corynebacterium neomassiliense TaxID=2079482 RepID=UPI0010322FBE|nr:carbohydrate-binding domain-containing protein [Corynebacterium neomassiliense]
MRNHLLGGLAAASIAGVLALAACSTSDDSSASAETTTSTTDSASTSVYGDADLVNVPTASDALSANNEASSVDDSDWSADDATDWTGGTITEAGVYRISGDVSETVTVEAPDDAQVVLILDNATISSTDGPAINVVSADDVVISLTGTSTVSDTSSYAEDADTNAAIYVDADLTVTGDGTLNIKGNGADGITSTDDLVVKSGTLNVTAADDGLRGKDALVIEGGTVTVNSAGDALKSDQDEDATKGYVNITGGTIKLTTTAGDGIDATTDVIITGGDLDISAGGGAAAGKNEDSSTKGIKGGVYVIVDGGTVNVDSGDDAIHAKGGVRLSSGDLTLATGDDGVHAEVAAIFDGADVTVTESNEGLESGLITVSDGLIDVTSSDDGVNGSGSTTTEDGIAAIAESDSEASTDSTDAATTDGSAQGGMEMPAQGEMPTMPEGLSEGQMPPSGSGEIPSIPEGGQTGGGAGGMGGGMGGGDQSSGEQINVTGGTLTINAEGDGLDSNGDATISGGTVTVYGPTNDGNGALDVNGDLTVTGGELTAIGSSGMAVSPSNTDGQGWIAADIDGSAGDTITVKDSSGAEIASFTSEKDFANVVFSSSDLTNGETYTVTVGDTSTEVTAGVATEGTGPMGGGAGGGMPGSNGSNGSADTTASAQ